jgi:hypothetical protein
MMANRRFWHWTPRVLAAGFAIFLALFALDVFDEHDSFGEALVALFIHLTPNWLLLLALVVSWRWRVIGGLLFWGLGIFSLIFFGTFRHPLTFLIISLPVFVIGALFVFDAWLDTQQPQRLA